MDYKNYQSRLSQLSTRFHLMVVLVLGLLVSNVVLSYLVYFAWHHQVIEVTPFYGDTSYFKSASTVDNHYLSLMSENFINERLNVTPETVKSNHQRLLSYVNPRQYSVMLQRLTDEAKIITAKKMSSTFHITQIKSNPTKLSVIVSGILKRFVGLHALNDEPKTYQLKFAYVDGRLSILEFLSFKEKQHE